MADNNKINLMNVEIPDFVNNASKNLTDKPTQEIGQTFADIWFLTFGGWFGQKRDKREIKYAHDLELYKKELEDDIKKIPAEKRIEPDFQTVATALENSKYCVEHEKLRKMFIKLISKSMNSDKQYKISPSFATVIKQLSPLDAQIFEDLYKNRDSHNYIYLNKEVHCFFDLECLTWENYEHVSISISNLTRLGLIDIFYTVAKENNPKSIYDNIKNKSENFIELIDKKVKLYLDGKIESYIEKPFYSKSESECEILTKNEIDSSGFAEFFWGITDYGFAFCDCCIQ